MIIVYNLQSLKIVEIKTEKNDFSNKELAGTVLAEEITDEALIRKVWEAMGMIVKRCNVKLDDNGKIQDIEIITPYLGADR